MTEVASDRYTGTGKHVIKKSWQKASSNKDKRSMRQQECRRDDNILSQTRRDALDRYADTGKHVIKEELAEGQP